MPNTRPFAYNNGSTISGTSQIGDLAYGDLNPVNGGPNYSGNPGGVKWWMGPDEDNRYIIGKDVPTGDWPTQVPEGNIGTVRFWATNTRNDNQFLNRVNILPERSGETNFINTNDALLWLQTNGYFTNFLTDSDSGWFNKLYVTYEPGDITPNYYAAQQTYSSTRDSLYVTYNTYGSNDGYGRGNTIITNISSQTSGEFYFTQSSNYLPSSSKCVNDNGQFGSWGNSVIDNNSDYLYVFAGWNNSTDEDNDQVIIRYDLSDNTIDIDKEFTSDSDRWDVFSNPVYHTQQNKLVLPNAGTSPNNSEANIKIYNTSSLQISSSIDLEDSSKEPLRGALCIVNSDNSHILLQGKSKWSIWDISNTSFITSQSYGSGISWSGGGSNQRGSISEGIYLPSTEKYYFTATTNIAGSNRALIIVDSNSPYTQTTILIPNGTQSGDSNYINPPIYDSSRGVLWVSPQSGPLVAINTTTEKIVTTSNYNIGGVYTYPYFIDDRIFTTNGSSPITTFETSLLWPGN